MMRSFGPFAAVAAVAFVAGCAPAEKAAEPASATAVPPGSESCLNLASIRESKVVDDSTIDFIMRDGRIYRNTLPYKCPSLGFEEAFTYSTSLSQLCSTDIIRVIHQGGGPQLGASCGLGVFVPYTPPPPAE